MPMLRASTRRLVLTTLAALVLLPLVWVASPAVADPGATRVVLKLGGEHDTNARRTAGSEVLGDEAARFFLKAQVKRSLSRLGELGTKLLLGAKMHRHIDDEDTFLTTAKATWRLPLATIGEAVRLRLQVRADLGDRSERASSRDYFRAGLVGGLGASLDRVALSLNGGYRTFIYKPDLDSNHAGATAELAMSVALWEGGIGSVSYVYLDRRFESARFIESEQLIMLDEDTLRRDDLHSLSFGLRHRGSWLGSVRYAIQINRSNSFGPGLMRHVMEAAWTQPLAWDLLFALNGRIQRTTYDDPVRIDETLQIDDENRNHLAASLSLPLAAPLWLEARYSLYTQALDDDADFIRQLFYLGLSADFDPLLSPEGGAP